MTPQPRSDKGQARKVTPEELLEAINAAKPHFHNRRTNKRRHLSLLHREGLARPDRIAQTTFYRFIREYKLLAPAERRRQETPRVQHEVRQPTLAGRHHVRPVLRHRTVTRIAASRPSSSPSSTTPAASSATASSSSRRTSTPWCRPSAPPSTNAASPNNCSSTTARSTARQEITLICARVGCLLRHTAVRDAAAKGKIERFFRRVRDQFLIRKLDLSSLDALNRQFTALGRTASTTRPSTTPSA